MALDPIAELSTCVPTVDREAYAAALGRHADLAKPAGSLGRLEQLGAQLSAIAGRCPPPVPNAPAVVIAAADHGVHAQRITPWPQEITARMVELFCAGEAAVNALAATVGATVTVIDVGCVRLPSPHASLRSRRVRAGTADLSRGPAMAVGEAVAAIEAGVDVVAELIEAGADLIVAGDMGIANTTATSCLVAALTGSDPASTVGPGAGVVDETLAHKTEVVTNALEQRLTDGAEPLATLAAVGGLEHAALTGVMLGAAARRTPVVLDGVITNAAALMARAICPRATSYMIAGHRSPEPGAGIALDVLGVTPLLDLGLRLGEGSGGVLAVPLVQAAARVLTEMATLRDL